MTKRKKAFVVLVIAILLLILELLPYGAVLDFAHMFGFVGLLNLAVGEGLAPPEIRKNIR